MAKNTRGFTIVEILISLVVIGILATLATLQFSGMKTRAQGNALAAEIRKAVEGFDAYAAKQRWTSWHNETTMLNPPVTAVSPARTFANLIAHDPSLGDYIQANPIVKDYPGLGWEYDNNGDTLGPLQQCSGQSRGTNIIITGVNDARIARLVDSALDTDNDINCGKVRYDTVEAPNRIIYKLSNNSTFN